LERPSSRTSSVAGYSEILAPLRSNVPSISATPETSFVNLALALLRYTRKQLV
jgi:hypothetical protein